MTGLVSVIALGKNASKESISSDILLVGLVSNCFIANMKQFFCRVWEKNMIRWMVWMLAVNQILILSDTLLRTIRKVGLSRKCQERKQFQRLLVLIFLC